MERVLCNTIILREVSLELGLDLREVKAIVDSQSEFTKEVMESNTYDSIRWPYLGVFRSKPKEIQILNHLKGLSKEQGEQFKKDIRTGKIRLIPEDWD